jgi:hypothetical protein
MTSGVRWFTAARLSVQEAAGIDVQRLPRDVPTRGCDQVRDVIGIEHDAEQVLHRGVPYRPLQLVARVPSPGGKGGIDDPGDTTLQMTP